MKYIKQYESNSNLKDIEVGDYVYCEVPEDAYTPNKFIVKITKIRPTKTFEYRVLYIDPNDDDVADRAIRSNEIIAFAKTIEELEPYMSAIKYNI